MCGGLVLGRPKTQQLFERYLNQFVLQIIANHAHSATKIPRCPDLLRINLYR